MLENIICEFSLSYFSFSDFCCQYRRV